MWIPFESKTFHAVCILRMQASRLPRRNTEQALVGRAGFQSESKYSLPSYSPISYSLASFSLRLGPAVSISRSVNVRLP